MKSKENRAIILIGILMIAGPLLYFLYNSWSQRPMNETLLEVIDDREVISMTFYENFEEGPRSSELSDNDIDNFVASLEGHDTNTEDANQIVYVPSYWFWDKPINKELFGEIEGETSSLVITFDNGESETIHFNESEMQINQDYYTMGYNPLIPMMEAESREVITQWIQ